MCEPEDECKADTYPCAGGDKERTFCVDMAPPEAYKCSCLDAYDSILPDQADVRDPVPAAWRPIACLEKEMVVSSDTSTLTTKASVVPTPSPTSPGFCKAAADCAGNNYACDETTSQCMCPLGFAEVGANCQLENECAPGFSNDCHRFATCSEEPAPIFYSCRCSEGFSDKYPGLNKTGTVCQQENGCETGTHDCDISLTCVDRAPPQKWECIEPTPAPTNQPTPSPTAPRPVVPAKEKCTLTVASGGDYPGCDLCGFGRCTDNPDSVYDESLSHTCSWIEQMAALGNEGVLFCNAVSIDAPISDMRTSFQEICCGAGDE